MQKTKYQLDARQLAEYADMLNARGYKRIARDETDIYKIVHFPIKATDILTVNETTRATIIEYVAQYGQEGYKMSVRLAKDGLPDATATCGFGRGCFYTEWRPVL